MMNKKIRILALSALVALGLASCQKGSDFMSFTGVIDNGSIKTMIGSESTDAGGQVWTSVYWESGDKIKVYDFSNGSTSAEFTVTPNSSDATHATFTGPNVSATNFLAVYPETGNHTTITTKTYTYTASERKLTGLTVPMAQEAVPDSYYRRAAIMTGYGSSSDNIIHFKNFCALIAVTPKFDCSDIIITSDGNPLATEIKGLTLCFDANGNVSRSQKSNTSQTVRLQGQLNGSTRSMIAKDHTYYIAVLPGTYKLTFTFMAAPDDGSDDFIFLKKQSKQITLESNDLLNVGEFGADGWVTPDGNTEFWSETVGRHYQIYEGHEYADLDLPSGALWATHNIGAENDYDRGDYFAFGETEKHYTSLTWDNAARTSATVVWKKIRDTERGNAANDYLVNWSYSFRYYPYFDTLANSTSTAGNSKKAFNPSTTPCSCVLHNHVHHPFDSTSNNVPLAHNLDAAYVNWGGSISEHGGKAPWRMPTYAEVQELIQNTIHTWTNNYNNSGQIGYIFISKNNDTYIFIPGTGLFTHGGFVNKVESYYWTASYNVNGVSHYANWNCGCGQGCMMKFADNANVKFSNEWAMNGRCVRPMVKLNEIPSSNK